MVCSVIWDTLHEQRIQEGDRLHEVKLKYCKWQTLGWEGLGMKLGKYSNLIPTAEQVAMAIKPVW